MYVGAVNGYYKKKSHTKEKLSWINVGATKLSFLLVFFENNTDAFKTV